MVKGIATVQYRLVATASPTVGLDAVFIFGGLSEGRDRRGCCGPILDRGDGASDCGVWAPFSISMHVATPEEIAALEQLADEVERLRVEWQLSRATSLVTADKSSLVLPCSESRFDPGDMQLDWFRPRRTSDDKARLVFRSRFERRRRADRAATYTV